MAEGILRARYRDDLSTPKLLVPGTVYKLTIGLTDAPIWTSVLFTLPDGRTFIPNVPTEEVFTSPDRLKAEGWARTSRPGFPLGREAFIMGRADQGPFSLASMFPRAPTCRGRSCAPRRSPS